MPSNPRNLKPNLPAAPLRAPAIAHAAHDAAAETAVAGVRHSFSEFRGPIPPPGAAHRRRGQVFAFLIGSLAVLCATASTILGYPLAGGILGIGGVSALVSAFLVDRSHVDKPPEIPRQPDDQGLIDSDSEVPSIAD